MLVSFAAKKNQKDQCALVTGARAKVNLDFLKFSILYKTKECTTGTNALGGRMINYEYKNKKGILLTTAASGEEKLRAQNENSFYGKIWFMSLDGEKKVMFSKGHRN